MNTAIRLQLNAKLSGSQAMKAAFGLAGTAIFALLIYASAVCWAQKPDLDMESAHTQAVTSVAFSPDGKTLASGSDDMTVKLWNLSTGEEVRTLKANYDGVQSVAFSPDGKTLASAGRKVPAPRDNTVKLWDVSNGAELLALDEGNFDYYEVVVSVAFSPDGKTLAGGISDKTVLWDVSTGEVLCTLKGHSEAVTSVAFSPEGKTLASGGDDMTVKLWNISTGAEIRTLKGHSLGINSVAFSPDGKIVASGNYDKTITLWDVSRGAELRTLIGHSAGVTSVAFSPDGKNLAGGSSDNTIKLWNVSTGAELRTLKGHYEAVNSVAFSRDGKMLASGGQDAEVKLWDVSTGAALRSLKGRQRNGPTETDKLPSSFTDDFSEKKWSTNDGQFGKLWYANGEYHMKATAGGYMAIYGPDAADYKTENATVKVTVRSVDGISPDTGYGLAIHGEKKDGQLEDYSFLIYTGRNPQYKIVIHKGGVETALVPWTPSSAIRLGASRNQLEVRVKDDNLRFYINGQFITSVTDSENYRRGRVGFYTSDVHEVAFDDLQITRKED